MHMTKEIRQLIVIVVITIIATIIALPPKLTINWNDQQYSLSGLRLPISLGGRSLAEGIGLKYGLDIQGGMQVVLQADMTQIPQEDRQNALEASKEIISRRVDLYGVSEPLVQTSSVNEEYRILVELAGVDDTQEALNLIGQTAQLTFQLLDLAPSPTATSSAQLEAEQQGLAVQPTQLTGSQLRRTSVQFDPTTGEPVVALEFNDEGRELFAELTRNNIGKQLAIFLDDQFVMAPVIQTEIIDGNASITGQFSVEQAQNLSIQLNAGALPVPIKVLEQRVVGASLGKESISKSTQAGVVGIGLVILFMILIYKVPGFLASLGLVLYTIYTIALYKILNVTLTLPGIAGLLLSVGMAVDANILIFERMKEELRLGKPFERARELGFGRAWDSIKDANIATILTALVLINPLDFWFLNRSGSVRGFGTTLLIGVLLSLFTGVFISRTLLRLFLREPKGDR